MLTFEALYANAALPRISGDVVCHKWCCKTAKKCNIFLFLMNSRKVDSDRIQSFHMQALRRILGIRWYDKVPNAVVNERTNYQICRLLLLTDVIHYLDTYVAYRRTHLLRRHFNCQ